jgi:hypothetical protein
MYELLSLHVTMSVQGLFLLNESKRAETLKVCPSLTSGE